MKKTVVVCDKCGKGADDTTSNFLIPIRRAPDGETMFQNIDLCSACKTSLLDELIDKHLAFQLGTNVLINRFMGKTVPVV